MLPCCCGHEIMIQHQKIKQWQCQDASRMLFYPQNACTRPGPKWVFISPVVTYWSHSYAEGVSSDISELHGVSTINISQLGETIFMSWHPVLFSVDAAAPTVEVLTSDPGLACGKTTTIALMEELLSPSLMCRTGPPSGYSLNVSPSHHLVGGRGNK